VPVSVGVDLEEDSTGCMFGGISGDGEGCGEVREVENRFQQEKVFERVKRGLASGSPVPLEVFLSEVDEEAGDVRVVGDEPSVEVGKAKEGAYVLDFCRGWPFGDSVKLDRVHGKLTGFNDHSEVFYLVSGEFAFLKFEVQIEFSHALEDALGVFFMCSGVRGEDKEVIHVDDEPSFCDHVPKGVVHESLESGRGVGEAEEHNSRFKEAFMDDEGGFPLVSIFDVDVVVAPPNIELCEDFSVPEFINEVGD